MSGLAVHVHRITVHGKILAGEKLANRELFAKIFLANIHRYTENVSGICTDCSLCILKNFPRQ